MKHTCHAKGCPVPVPPEMLMCRRHWFAVTTVGIVLAGTTGCLLSKLAG